MFLIVGHMKVEPVNEKCFQCVLFSVCIQCVNRFQIQNHLCFFIYLFYIFFRGGKYVTMGPGWKYQQGNSLGICTVIIVSDLSREHLFSHISVSTLLRRILAKLTNIKAK